MPVPRSSADIKAMIQARDAIMERDPNVNVKDAHQAAIDAVAPYVSGTTGGTKVPDKIVVVAPPLKKGDVAHMLLVDTKGPIKAYTGPTTTNGITTDFRPPTEAPGSPTIDLGPVNTPKEEGGSSSSTLLIIAACAIVGVAVAIYIFR
jgi:hypothetical protein